MVKKPGFQQTPDKYGHTPYF